MLTLGVYDIADNRRRTKLAKFLEGYGRRVQESVFECFLSLEEMQRLHQKVMGRIQAAKNLVLLVALGLILVTSECQPPPHAKLIDL
ncbi:MAG: CRISPR-associated endonuclease Cas2 [Almyronema sp.]